MLHSDKNNDNTREDATAPYQPIPQSPSMPQGDFHRGWTDPNQYMQPSAGRHMGQNYNPVTMSAQENVGQRPLQSSQPNYPNPSDPRLAPSEMQWRQNPMWGTPPPPNNRPSPNARGCRSGALLALTLALLLVFGVGLFSGWVFAQSGIMGAYGPTSWLQTNANSKTTIPAVNGNGSNLDAVREAVVSKVEPAVVQINVRVNNGIALGSGVIIDKRGYIVTNNHVVADALEIQVVLADNTKYPAQITGTDPTDDLAVIKINVPTALVTATLGNSSQLHVGQEVLAIGNPLGITQTVTRGIVSALGRNVREQNNATIPGAIQTDAPINPGNSGGALADLQGEVIGIPTLTAIDPEFNQPASGVGFAIPSNRVNFIAQQLIQNGKVTHSGRSAIGITAQTVSPTLADMRQLGVDHGVLIAAVLNGGPAQRAGLQAGDVIVQVDNTQIDSLLTLQDALLPKDPGDRATVKVYRGNQQLTVNLILASS